MIPRKPPDSTLKETSFKTLTDVLGYAKVTESNDTVMIGSSKSLASSESDIEGSRSMIANTLREAASPFCNWLSNIPRMNIGIVILVDINRKVTNCPTLISPELITQPPAETRSPNEIPATT